MRSVRFRMHGQDARDTGRWSSPSGASDSVTSWGDEPVAADEIGSAEGEVFVRVDHGPTQVGRGNEEVEVAEVGEIGRVGAVAFVGGGARAGFMDGVGAGGVA